MRHRAPPLDGTSNCASRFARMAAIAELAPDRHGFDILEAAPIFSWGLPGFQCPHSGRVDNRATSRSREELSMGRRVTAATIIGADFLRRLRCAPKQQVGEGRLADT